MFYHESDRMKWVRVLCFQKRNYFCKKSFPSSGSGERPFCSEIYHFDNLSLNKEFVHRMGISETPMSKTFKERRN